MYELHEIDGMQFSETIRNLNSLIPEWPPLQDRHLVNGYWWLVFRGGGEVVGFAGMVPMVPFPNVGYLKRCLVLDRGHGLQYRLMKARELKAKQLGWTHLVTECRKDNTHSAANLRKEFTQCDPEQPWAFDSTFWVKTL